MFVELNNGNVVETNFKLDIVENVENFIKENDPNEIVKKEINNYDVVINFIKTDSLVKNGKTLLEKYLNIPEPPDSDVIRSRIFNFRENLEEKMKLEKDIIMALIDIMNRTSTHEGAIANLCYLATKNCRGTTFIKGRQKNFIDDSDEIGTEILEDLKDQDTINIYVSIDERLVKYILI